MRRALAWPPPRVTDAAALSRFAAYRTARRKLARARELRAAGELTREAWGQIWDAACAELDARGILSTNARMRALDPLIDVGARVGVFRE